MEPEGIWIIVFDIDHIGTYDDPSHRYSDLCWLKAGWFASEIQARQYISQNSLEINEYYDSVKDIRPMKLEKFKQPHEITFCMPGSDTAIKAK